MTNNNTFKSKEWDDVDNPHVSFYIPLNKNNWKFPFTIIWKWIIYRTIRVNAFIDEKAYIKFNSIDIEKFKENSND